MANESYALSGMTSAGRSFSNVVKKFFIVLFVYIQSVRKDILSLEIDRFEQRFKCVKIVKKKKREKRKEK